MSDERERPFGDEPSVPSGGGSDGIDGPDGLDGLDDIEGVDGTIPAGEPEAEVGPGPGGTARRRLGGLVSLLLGVLGTLVAVVLAFLALRLVFGASGTADTLLSPVTTAVDRLEERIDQADDLIDGQGIDADRVAELRARVDGLVDLTTAASDGFDGVDGHPVYRFLPADLSGLGGAIDRDVASAAAIDETLGSGSTVGASAAATMAGEIDAMQGRVTGTRSILDDARSSLRSWLRLGGLIGFLAALWLGWSQLVFARRGWRGFRNRPL